MRNSNVLVILNLAAVLALAALGVGYRTPWVQTHVPAAILFTLIAITVLIACASTMLHFSANRNAAILHAIEANLEDIPNTDDLQQSLGHLAAVPVGNRMPKAGQGWNRLVAAIDDIINANQLDEVKQTIGQFLCSYDSQRLLGLLDTLPDGVLLADSDGTIILANRPSEGLLARPLSEFISKSIVDLFEDDDASNQLKSLLEHKTVRSEHYFEITSGEQPNETVLQVSCRKLEQRGQSSEILLIIRDVTQQKMSESSCNDFVAHVSHELRTPLTNIRAYAETLLSDMILDATAQKEAFNVINDETARLTRLINDVLNLSRIETGSLSLDKGEVVLDRLIRQCINDVKAMARSKNITIQTNYHPKLPNLFADREKLAEVINNIMSNAIKYTPDDGSVFVETNVDESSVYIKVTDTGYGIADDCIDKIFDKFYRVDSKETADITGSGLGLAISKEIVTVHGGTIDVTSELNSGTEMLIKLPLTITGPVLGPQTS